MKPFDFTVPLRGTYDAGLGLPAAVTLRPIRVRDELAVQSVKDPAEAEVRLVISLTELPRASLLELESADYGAIVAKVVAIREGKHLGASRGEPGNG